MNHLTLNEIAFHIESDGELRVAVKELDGTSHEGFVPHKSNELLQAFIRQWALGPHRCPHGFVLNTHTRCLQCEEYAMSVIAASSEARRLRELSPAELVDLALTRIIDLKPQDNLIFLELCQRVDPEWANREEGK